MGLDISITPLIITIIEITFLFSQFLQYLSTRSKRENSAQFIVLNLIFVIYNFSFILNLGKSLPSLTGSVISFGIGLLLIAYFLFFTFNILKPTKKHVNQTKLFLILLIASSPVSFYSLISAPYSTVMPKSLWVPTVSFLLFSVILLVIPLVLKSKMAREKTLKYLALTLLLMVLSVIPNSINEGSIYQVILLNLLFVFAATYQLYMQFLHSKKEMNQLNKQGFNFERSISDQKSGSLDNFVLTKRRRQVAKLLLEGKNFYEIGDELNIAKGTVTKHASDVYKDTNCVDIDDFLMKFGGEIK